MAFTLVLFLVCRHQLQVPSPRYRGLEDLKIWCLCAIHLGTTEYLYCAWHPGLHRHWANWGVQAVVIFSLVLPSQPCTFHCTWCPGLRRLLGNLVAWAVVFSSLSLPSHWSWQTNPHYSSGSTCGQGRRRVVHTLPEGKNLCAVRGRQTIICQSRRPCQLLS